MTEFWEMRLSKALRGLRCNLLGHRYIHRTIKQEVRHTQQKRNLYGRLTHEVDEVMYQSREVMICRWCHRLVE